MAAASRVRGFTLVELLISITVLSMVIGIASYAFSLFSRNWDGQRSGFDNSIGQFQRVDLMTDAIRDSLAWVVLGAQTRDGFGFYFLGREEGMTFVTESPIFDDRGLAVVRLFREREAGSATWRLVYEEAPLQGLLLRDANQVLPFRDRLVIVKGLPSVDFSYFGWRSLEYRNQGDEAGSIAPEWFAEYDGLVRQQQPLRVALRMGGAIVNFDLAERDEVVIGRILEPQ